MQRLNVISIRLAMAIAVVFSMLVSSIRPDVAHAASGLIPLYSWWNKDRGDNFATTYPAWAGTPGAIRSSGGVNYGFVRVEGFVFDPALPQPQGTVKLYSWYSSMRGDNFITSDPSWAGHPGGTHDPGYIFVRMEGYIHDQPRAGTLPLTSWWGPTSQDNYATTKPDWGSALGATHGEFTSYRIEGNLVPTPEPQIPDLPEAFGYGRVAARGARPLLTIMIEYSDVRFHTPHTVAFFDDLLFGAAAPNIAAYFNENSLGLFTWKKAAIVGPVQHPDDPATPANESMRNCAFSCPGRSDKTVRARAIELAASAGFDFARYDTDHDGRVTNPELTVLIVDAAPFGDAAGAVRSSDPGCVRPGGLLIDICLGIPGVNEDATFATIAHELVHSLGMNQEVYGSHCLSQNMSLMSCTGSGLYHLDPWHKIQLGWVKPRIYPITYPGASALLGATAGRLHVEPIILYDPRRGRNEYFILEYRNRSVGTYDVNMADPAAGVAIWYVQTDAAGNLQTIPGAIEWGNNGVMESVRAGDDYMRDAGKIWTGANDQLDSIVRAGSDDALIKDAADWMIGSPFEDGVPGSRGQSTLWRASHGEITSLRWLDGTSTGLRIRVGTSSGTAPLVSIEWRTTAAAPAPRVDELRGDVVPAGITVVINGDFGVDYASRVVSLIRGTTRRDVPIIGGTCGYITVQLPADIAPATYQLVVYNNAARTTSSNSLPLTVVAP
jgi:M6 family metalloprotease-like protein